MWRWLRRAQFRKNASQERGKPAANMAETGCAPYYFQGASKPAFVKKCALRMRKNILGLPALQIQLGASREEFETSFRKLNAAFARQHRIQAIA
jgi:hypothetical protein